MSNTVFHGGRLDLAIQKYGGERGEWLDLSTGINPNAYPVSALGDHVWQRLPDGQDLARLMQAARCFYRVSNSIGMVAANGTQALIELLPRVLPCKRVAIVSPTYGEHEHTWRKGGAHVDTIAKGAALPRLCNAIVVVNPNNPDADVHSLKELLEIAQEIKQHNGYLVVDEAFCDASPENSLIPSLPENAMVYRSFGKFFGLAGLRLGFLIGPEWVVHQVENLLGPWCVSGPALEIANRAFSDEKWISETRVSLMKMARQQAELLVKHGLENCGTNPLFIYAGHQEGSKIFEALADHKILVRPFPETPNRLRFGLCKDGLELARLDEALRTAIGKV